MKQETKGYTVITGASSGIGYETAKAFAARGKHLVVVARRKDRLKALKDEILDKYPAVDVILKPFLGTCISALFQPAKSAAGNMDQ